MAELKLRSKFGPLRRASEKTHDQPRRANQQVEIQAPALPPRTSYASGTRTILKRGVRASDPAACLSGAPLWLEIFQDGFETGDLSSWSAVVDGI